MHVIMMDVSISLQPDQILDIILNLFMKASGIIVDNVRKNLKERMDWKNTLKQNMIVFDEILSPETQ